MENPRTLALVVALAVLYPGAVFAYGRDTHKGLADATLQAYEQLRGTTFSAEEKAALIQGTWDEDDDWRFMRHFYDPVNNKGLFGEYVASKYWAQDTEGQGNYNCFTAWLCNGDHIKYSDAFFSSPTDFSWDRAIYEYAWGNKVKGAGAVGHALHLIQDATVPAHVRDDAHPSKWGVDIQADPYEKYSERYTQGSVPAPTNLLPPEYGGIGHVFDEVASYTNLNFFSSDTMDAYTSPAKKDLLYDSGYAVNTKINVRIASARQFFNKRTGSITTEVFLEKSNDTVQSDYWRALSKKAIESGVGVIDLFFREVEKEKKTGVLKARNVSAAELHAKETAKKGFKYVKALYGSSLEQSDVEELLADNAGQAGAAALAVANEPSPPQQGAPPVKPAVPKVSQTNPPKPQAAPQVLGASVSPVEEPTQEVPPEQDVTPSIPAPTPTQTESQPNTPPPSSGGSSGSTGGSPTQTIDTPTSGGDTPESTPDPLTLSILSPSENDTFATTSVTFIGTTSASSVVTAAYDSTLATTTTDDNGSWTFTLSLVSGTTTVSFSAATSTETTATSTRTVAVDVSSPDAPSIAIDECAASFVAGDCTVAATAVTVSWDTVSGATYYDVVKDTVILATTTATSATSDISVSATTTFSVVAHKSNGTAATSTEKAVFVTTQPLIISEVAWAGTNTYPEDEWMEVKNVTNSTLDLSHFVITTPDGSRTIQLSGTLAPDVVFTGLGFLIIERSADAVSGVLNALTSDFTQLSDSGEQLLLQWGDGLATTTVDSTPAVATCGSWCAGAALGSIGYSVQNGTSTMNLTMERKDGSADGSLASSWRTTDTYSFYGNDRSGSAIYGTPGVANSSGHPTVGWFCSPDTVSITSGAHYTPPSSSCRYLLRAIGTNTSRYSGLYRGDVGSSTRVTQDFASVAYMRNRTDIIPDPQAGEHFFIAVYEMRLPGFDPPLDDNTLFDTYFKTGGTPPHSNYFVIPWVYGP